MEKPWSTVVLFGKGDLAIHVADFLLKQGETLQVVPVVPEPTWCNSLVEWCQEHDVPYVASGRHQDLEQPVELGVSVFYDKLFKAPFINSCGKLINIHNSPLPKYRGMAPINWALKDEQESHGITIHEITPGIDDGPILARATYSIYPEFDEVEDVYKRALAYGKLLFETTYANLARIVPREQDESEASHHFGHESVNLGDRRDFTRAKSTA